MTNNWHKTSLGEVVSFQRGLTYSKGDERDLSTNIVLRANNIDLNSGQLDFTELRYIDDTISIPKEKIVLRGSLIICTASGSRSHLGKVALVDNDYGYALGGFMGQLTPRPTINSKLLFFLLTSESYKDFIGSLSAGVNINNLRFDDLKEFSFFLPPLPEQKRIVAILDEAFSGIARAKEIAEKDLANAREIFESYLQGVFANPGEDWKNKTLGNVCSLITDGKHGDCENEANSGYYFLSAKDVKYDTLNYTNARQITKDGFEETHRRTNLKPGDICMVNTGATIGRISVAPDNPKTYKTTFQKSVAVIKTIPSLISSSYCCYLLKSDLNKLVKVSSGTAVHNLLLGDLKRHVITIPSLQEQKRIVANFDSLLTETKRLESIYLRKLASLHELKTSLLHQAFSGSLTGGAAS